MEYTPSLLLIYVPVHAKVLRLVQKTELRNLVSAPTSKVRFDGTFNRLSPYKGPPSPEVDAVWHEVTMCKYALSFQKITDKILSGNYEYFRGCFQAPKRFPIRS